MIRRNAIDASGEGSMGDVRVLVVGVGNMGASHAKAYHKLAGFEVCGLISRAIGSRSVSPDGRTPMRANAP